MGFEPLIALTNRRSCPDDRPRAVFRRDRPRHENSVAFECGRDKELFRLFGSNPIRAQGRPRRSG